MLSGLNTNCFSVDSVRENFSHTVGRVRHSLESAGTSVYEVSAAAFKETGIFFANVRQRTANFSNRTFDNISQKATNFNSAFQAARLESHNLAREVIQGLSVMYTTIQTRISDFYSQTKASIVDGKTRVCNACKKCFEDIKRTFVGHPSQKELSPDVYKSKSIYSLNLGDDFTILRNLVTGVAFMSLSTSLFILGTMTATHLAAAAVGMAGLQNIYFAYNQGSGLKNEKASLISSTYHDLQKKSSAELEDLLIKHTGLDGSQFSSHGVFEGSFSSEMRTKLEEATGEKGVFTLLKLLAQAEVEHKAIQKLSASFCVDAECLFHDSAISEEVSANERFNALDMNTYFLNTYAKAKLNYAWTITKLIDPTFNQEGKYEYYNLNPDNNQFLTHTPVYYLSSREGQSHLTTRDIYVLPELDLADFFLQRKDSFSDKSSTDENVSSASSDLSDDNWERSSGSNSDFS